MKKLLLLAVMLLVAAFAAWAAWLVYTPAGLRFALRSVATFTPVRIQAGEVTGRLADSFLLRHLDIRLSETSISIEALACTWQPANLLAGSIAIGAVKAEHIAIEDLRPKSKKPLSFTWPRVGGTVAGMHAWVKELRVEGVRYRRADTEVAIDGFTASLFWHHGILSLSRLNVTTSPVTAVGTLEAGFLTPLLKVDLDIAPREKGTEGAESLKRLLLKGELKQGSGADGLEGPFSLQGVTPSDERLDVAGQLGLAPDRVQAKGLKISHSAFAGVVTGSGEVMLDGEEPHGRADVTIQDVHARKGAYAGVIVAGEVHATGKPDDYRGTFNIGNKGKAWQAVQVAGRLSGNRESLNLGIADGRWLGGRVAGSVEAGWGAATRLVASLSGRKLNPALLGTEWTGEINLDADLRVERRPEGALKAAVHARFPASTLRGRPLTGLLDGRIDNGVYDLARLELHGKGFDVQASGVVQKRVDFNAQVTDLSGLVPETRGSLFTSGWLRWQDRELSGNVMGRGNGIALRGASAGKAQFTARSAGSKGPIDLEVQGEAIGYQNVHLDRLRIVGSGTMEGHTVTIDLRGGPRAARLTATGGLANDRWTGRITQVDGTDDLGAWKLEAPAALAISRERVRTETIALKSARGESLVAGGDLTFNPLRGSGTAAWKALRLSRLEPLMKRGRVEGTTSGVVDLRWPKEGRTQLDGNMLLDGVYRESKVSVTVKGKMSASWDEKGLKAGWETAVGKEGTFTGSLRASGAPALQLPETADLAAAWEGLDVALLDPWLPPPLLVQGRTSGKVTGTILPGSRVQVTGSTSIAQGKAAWRQEKGLLSAGIQNGSLRFSWSDGTFQGNASLVLAGYGKVEAHFTLPLPARLPAAFLPDGPVSLSVKAQVGELGVVTALLPGLVNESRGRLLVDIAGNGTWRNPAVTGKVTLEDAGATLPTAGIKLERVRAEAELSGRNVRLVRLRAESGPGWIEAAGEMALEEWRPVRYQGGLKGENFQVVNLPDLRVSVNPAITFQGDTKRFSARGDILIPRMAIYGERGQTVVHASPDIVIVDAPAKKKKELPFALDIQVRVTLGENVTLETRGVDARLAGAVDVDVKSLDNVAARGTVRVVKGGYRAYGIRLDIARGNIRFFGPVDRPTLDILAVKKTGDVTAGVEVSGSARSPAVNLYSSPAMPDTDKLSYILLGHPLSGADAGQSSQFMSTAGFFQSGTAPGFTSEARMRAGLSGVEPGGSQEEAIRSMVSLGRYLTPGLYVGVGHSLLTNQNQVTMRYRLSRSWEVESRLGGESGMDLFYRIDFD